jgi:peptidoglycan pentaglycine glycine transferase (the first glycine)
MNPEGSTAPIEVSTTVPAAEWNQFLEFVPDSHHLQTTCWAELKAPGRWEADRLALVQAGKIVAGLQLLHRRVSRLGRMGYVPRGPVFGNPDERLPKQLLTALLKLACEKQLRYLTVQPPRGGARFVPELTAHGFSATPFQVAPTATVLIEVQHPAEVLRARMQSSNRRALRKAEASGLRARVGTAADLPRFHALLTMTGKRHGFTPPALEYFERMWRLFAATDDIALFLAEHDGEPVAGELDVTFGDTLVSKRAGWSGKHSKSYPNELVVWTAMNWARDRGLKYYDMEGFDPELAGIITSGAEVPAASKMTHHWFKLGFGGQVVVLPDNYEIVRMPVVGAIHRVVWGRWLSLGFRRWILKKAGLL